MDIRYIHEPSLQFGKNVHISPRHGLFEYNPFDIDIVRPENINLGIVGKSESIDIVLQWLDRCKSNINPRQGKESNLNINFCGFNQEIGFKSAIKYDDTYIRKINNSEFTSVIRSSGNDSIIELIASLYLEEIKFLTKNKKPDVILCVLDSTIYKLLKTDKLELAEEELEEKIIDEEENKDDNSVLEQNFRRYLKAKAMQYGVPIQIMREKICNPTKDMQDEATIAWNFFTALYYKASGTPWGMIRKDSSINTCYAGVSFFNSRDRKTIQTSIAQIFNELGKGVILRGDEIKLTKYDRTPHLSGLQAYNLLFKSLQEYYAAIKLPPKRLVLHKTSNFSQEEIDGFREAAKQCKIYQIDLITILDSNFRLYRKGQYPPLRGTHLKFNSNMHLLYTRGSVPFYATYPGKYIPQPIEVRLFEFDESPDLICDEILALTKMNWNNTQFDRKYPITIECARNVGDILKYLDTEDSMQLKYSFYM